MATILPDPPAPIVRPAEYAFGDDVAAAEERLIAQVDGALHARFGQAAEARFVAPAGTDMAALRGWYAGRATGWKPLDDVDGVIHAGRGGGFGLSDGRAAFVLLWVSPGETGGDSPVTVLRYGGKS